MVVDNGCDQSIININYFLVKSFADKLFDIAGALHSMNPSQFELVSDAFTRVTLPDNSRVIFKMNQGFFIETHHSVKPCSSHIKLVHLAL